MKNNKRTGDDSTVSTMKKRKCEEWTVNWLDTLREIVSCEKDTYLLKMNIISGYLEGVLRRGDEVIDVIMKGNNVELMIVNLQDHSMRLVNGYTDRKLREVDLSELKGKASVDLNDDGRRWEGEVLRGKVFGYGRLYDEKNKLEYEGWIIKGKKRCYGIEYWSDIGTMKYCGCFHKGEKTGKGVMYDQQGKIVYDGLCIEDHVIDCDVKYSGIEKIGLVITSYSETLIIGDDFELEGSSVLLTWALASLKLIRIGSNCFKKYNSLVIDGLNALESIEVARGSFELNDRPLAGSKCVIQNCESLQEIRFGAWSFNYFESLELKNLHSLKSILIGDRAFEWCYSVVFENMNDGMNDK